MTLCETAMKNVQGFIKGPGEGRAKAIEGLFLLPY